MSKEPSPAQKMIGDFAPKLVDLTDRVLFGEVWERLELSKPSPWSRSSAASMGPAA